jgi:hypothetical protein
MQGKLTLSAFNVASVEYFLSASGKVEPLAVVAVRDMKLGKHRHHIASCTKITRPQQEIMHFFKIRIASYKVPKKECGS